MLIFWLLILIVGFVLLIKGADFFVDGASSLAQKMGVSALVIGLTIVAMGTSLPEMMVSVTSSINGANGLSFGNVLGSNLFNTLAIIGVATWFAPLVVKRTTVYKEIPFLVMATAITAILAFDNVFHGSGEVDLLNRFDGIILLLIFVVFLYYLFGLAKQSRAVKAEEEAEIAAMPILSNQKRWFYIGGGLGGVLLGGVLAVRGASELALMLGMSQTLVGLTIVAVGTSLPEFVTSIVAVKKGRVDLAVGNVVGSNIFNLLLVLGISSLISPVSLESNLIVDIFYLLFISILFWFFAKSKKRIGKLEGGVLFVLYVVYLVYVIGRNYWGWSLF